MSANPRLRPLCLLLCTAAVSLGLPAPLASQTLPGEIAGHKLPVPGRKVAGTTARLSEVEAEIVARLPPQGQAERLLQYAISHHVGATDEIKARVDGWRGKIARTDALNTLMDVALNGANLRVRAAAVEIELAAQGITKSSDQVDGLLREVQANPKGATFQIWLLGLLANRGVAAERIHNELRVLTQASEEDVRLRAVSAIGYIGSDETVPDLVNAFHRDPSFNVRINGGGCCLAHCGMLTRAQRMLALPGLMDMVEDPKLDEKTRTYGYRALREITDEQLPDAPGPWRAWYAAHGAETTERFRRFEEPAERER